MCDTCKGRPVAHAGERLVLPGASILSMSPSIQRRPSAYVRCCTTAPAPSARRPACGRWTLRPRSALRRGSPPSGSRAKRSARHLRAWAWAGAAPPSRSGPPAPLCPAPEPARTYLAVDARRRDAQPLLRHFCCADRRSRVFLRRRGRAAPCSAAAHRASFPLSAGASSCSHSVMHIRP